MFCKRVACLKLELTKTFKFKLLGVRDFFKAFTKPFLLKNDQPPDFKLQ